MVKVTGERTTVRDYARFASLFGVPNPYPIPSINAENFHRIQHAASKLYGCNHDDRSYFVRTHRPEQPGKKAAHVLGTGDFRSLSKFSESTEHPALFGVSTGYA